MRQQPVAGSRMNPASIFMGPRPLKCGAAPCYGGMLLVESKTNGKTIAIAGAGAEKQPCAPVTYTFDGRAFIVQSVFKDGSAHTLRDVLLRLMRADLEQS